MYKNLKEEHMTARKARAKGKDRAALISGVISDIDEKVLVDRKNAETDEKEFIIPDAIVVATIKNQIKNLNKGISETLDKVGEVDAVFTMREKVNALAEFLPEAIEGDDLRFIIQGLGASNMGQAMGMLKKQSIELGFDFDGKEASILAKEIFV